MFHPTKPIFQDGTFILSNRHHHQLLLSVCLLGYRYWIIRTPTTCFCPSYNTTISISHSICCVMPSNAQIDAPMTLTGLFPPDSSDEEDNHDDKKDGGQDDNKNTPNDGCLYEVQTMNLVGKDLQVRQYDYHSHNANQVWPGTFNLAEYLLMPRQQQQQQQQDWGHILELGTATGILSIRLAFACRSIQHGAERSSNNDTADAEYCCCSSITTSDVCDEGNQIEHNVRYNVNLNRRVILGWDNENDNEPCPIDIPHIPHTWGTGWKASVMKRQQKLQEGLVAMDKDEASSSSSSSPSPPISLRTLEFDTIVASDILLYVSAYKALVETLQELMPVIVHHDVDNEEGVVLLANQDVIIVDEDCVSSTDQDAISSKKKKMKISFVMSWNRRMKESAEFFQLMKAGGFDCQHEGKCIYTFTRRSPEHDK